MQIKDAIWVTVVFLGLGILSIWLQFGLLVTAHDRVTEKRQDQSDYYDYYIEKFTTTATDKTGKKYQISADRMLHYPTEDRALLDNPHIIQYHPPGDSVRAPQHIYAQSGWLYDDQSTVLLTGNVRVIQRQANGVATAAAKKMRIHLKK